MPLTDTAIHKAVPFAKSIRLRDTGGLCLLLKPDGARWWRWDCRRPLTGQRNTLSLGTYPDTGLADAREKHREARKLLARGLRRLRRHLPPSPARCGPASIPGHLRRT